MKKIILTLAIIVISLFINTNVYAENLYNDYAKRNHQLIYDIVELNITETAITFNGWAIISDVDNNKNGRNTYISIVAKQYDKNKKKNVPIFETKVDEKTGYNNIYNNYLYEATCMKWASLENSNDSENCIQKYEDSTCKITYFGKNEKETVPSWSSLNNLNPSGFEVTKIPSCRYDNVGFDVKINLNEVKQKAINNNPIYFYIKVVYKKDGVVKKTLEKAIGVNDGAVTGDRSNDNVVVGGFSKYAKIEIPEGRVMNIISNNGNDIVKFRNSGEYVWNQYDSFEIIDTKKLSNAEKYGTLKVYKLKYYTNLTGEFRDGNVYGQKTSEYKYEETGWAHASWITIEGQVYMQLDNITNCPPETRNIENNECQETTYNETKNYIISKEINTTKEDHPYLNKLGNCNLYVKKTLRGEISVTQIGDFSLSLDSNKITSGMGFEMSAGYNGRMSYEMCHEKESIPELAYTIIYSYYDNEQGCILGTEVVEIKDKNSNEWKWFAEEAQKKLSDPSNNKKIVTSYDSNIYSEKNKNTATLNRWTANYIETTKDNKWMPGEEITYNLKFDLDNACINVNDAKIRYTNANCDPIKEIDGNKLYYTPLKYMEEKFPVWIEVSNLSMLKNNTWDLNYSCNVDTIQKLYNKDYSYKFIYRPISLSNPFPNRLPLNNWVKLYEDKDAFTKAMSRDDLEYQVTLTPTTIGKIKQNNKNNKYTSLSGISKTGQSSFLNDLIGTDRTNTFNNLGECSNNCWISNSKLELAK